jgi:hypothetical protein
MVHIIVLVCGYMLSVRADGMASGSGSLYDDDDFAQSAVSNVGAVDSIDTLQPYMYPGCTIKDSNSHTWTDVPMTLQECMSFCTNMQHLLYDKKCGYITFATNGGADGKGTCTAGSLGWNITATKTVSDFFNDDCYEPLSSSGTHITVLKQQFFASAAVTGDTPEIMPYTFSGCQGQGTDLIKQFRLPTQEGCFVECTETFNCVAVAYTETESCFLYSSDTLDGVCYDASASTEYTFYTKPYWEYKKSACHHDDNVPGDTAVIEVIDGIQLNECVKQCIDKDCVGITAEGGGKVLERCFLLRSTKPKCTGAAGPIESKFTLFNLNYFVDSLAIYNCHHDDRNGSPHLITFHSGINREACANLCVDNCVGITFKDADGAAEPAACFLLSSIVPSPKCAMGGVESKYTLYNKDYFFSADSLVTTNIYKGCRGDDTTVIGKVSDGVSDLYSKITKAQCEAFCNAVSACSAITVSNEQCTLHQEVGDMINSPTCDGADTVYYLSSAFTAQTEESLCNSSVKFDDICTPPLPAITIETKDGTTGRVIGIVAGSCVAVVGIYYVGRYIYRKITDESEGASFTQMFQL